jgi:serine/threonine protein phosphatase PrpC
VVVATFETGVPREAFQLFAVCDGVGGLQDGARCAALAISYAIANLIETRAVASTESRLRLAVEAANKGLCALYQKDGGTTFAAVILSSSGPAAVSIGDTRIYLADPKQPLKQLTVDDTIAGRLLQLQKTKKQPMGFSGTGLRSMLGNALSWFRRS